MQDREPYVPVTRPGTTLASELAEEGYQPGTTGAQSMINIRCSVCGKPWELTDWEPEEEPIESDSYWCGKCPLTFHE